MSFMNQAEHSQTNEGNDAYGCIFCRTGKEKNLTEAIERYDPTIRAIAVEKLRRRRMGHTFVREVVPVFPGYIFFRADAGYDVQKLSAQQDFYRLLRTPDGAWQLRGTDERFARMLFEQQGVLGFSRAYYENDRIRIVDGVLKNYEGRIIRVNRRAQTAQIALNVCSRPVTVWLGFELMNPCERGEETALRKYDEES